MFEMGKKRPRRRQDEVFARNLLRPHRWTRIRSVCREGEDDGEGKTSPRLGCQIEQFAGWRNILALLPFDKLRKNDIFAHIFPDELEEGRREAKNICSLRWNPHDLFVSADP
jgi:hypothetical protein